MQSLGSISHSVPRRMERLRMKKIKQTTMCGPKKGLLFCRGGSPPHKQEKGPWMRPCQLPLLAEECRASSLSEKQVIRAPEFKAALSNVSEVPVTAQWHRSKGKGQAGFSGPSLRALQEFIGSTLHVNEVWTLHYLLVNKVLETCGLIGEGEHFFKNLKMVFGWLWGLWIHF